MARPFSSVTVASAPGGVVASLLVACSACAMAGPASSLLRDLAPVLRLPLVGPQQFARKRALDPGMFGCIPVDFLYGLAMAEPGGDGLATVLYLGAARGRPYVDALKPAPTGGPSHKDWGQVPARLRALYAAGWKLVGSASVLAEVGSETGAVYALQRALVDSQVQVRTPRLCRAAGLSFLPCLPACLSVPLEVTGGVYALSGGPNVVPPRPLIANWITVRIKGREVAGR